MVVGRFFRHTCYNTADHLGRAWSNEEVLHGESRSDAEGRGRMAFAAAAQWVLLVIVVGPDAVSQLLHTAQFFE